MNAVEVINKKIDAFMNIVASENLSFDHIFWVFSLSGGKDSFTMSRAIVDWYIRNGFTIDCTGLFINQWEDPVATQIRKQFIWLDKIEIIDAREETLSMLSNCESLQAPCRKCSDIRRRITDDYIRRCGKKVPIIVCRGLHLTDMAISILWRTVMGYNSVQQLISEGKGKAISPLFGTCFLAKPLCFVREYECQEYARAFGYEPLTCNCRALKYPSRRDIIEESAALYYKSDMWEFEVNGVHAYLEDVLRISDFSTLVNISMHGKESKKNLIPDGFYDYSLEYYIREEEKSLDDKYRDFFDFESDLDKIGEEFVINNIHRAVSGKIPAPRLMRRQILSPENKRMIATLGPMWGIIAYDPEARAKMARLQQYIYHVQMHGDWKQTNEMLVRYYSESASG